MITVKNIFGDLLAKVSREELVAALKQAVTSQPIARVRRTVAIANYLFRVNTTSAISALLHLSSHPEVETVVVHDSTGQLYLI